jgi:hypothetical protein
MDKNKVVFEIRYPHPIDPDIIATVVLREEGIFIDEEIRASMVKALNDVIDSANVMNKPKAS